jgi:hypothetical protein
MQQLADKLNYRLSHACPTSGGAGLQLPEYARAVNAQIGGGIVAHGTFGGMRCLTSQIALKSENFGGHRFAEAMQS